MAARYKHKHLDDSDKLVQMLYTIQSCMLVCLLLIRTQSRHHMCREPITLKPLDFQLYGYTPGCRGCEWLETGLGKRQSHNSEFRARIEELLAKDVEGEKRLRESIDRRDAWLAKQGEGEAGNEDANEEDKGQQEATGEDANLEEVKKEREGVAESAAVVEDGSVEEIGDAEMTEQIVLEDLGAGNGDTRFPSPMREPATKRQIETEDESMGEENKARRLDIDAEMLSVEEKRILALTIMGVDVTEIFSPERVAKFAGRFGLTAGTSFDLTNGWVFWRQDLREMALKQTRHEQPFCIIGSPPCTKFS